MNEKKQHILAHVVVPNSEYFCRLLTSLRQSFNGDLKLFYLDLTGMSVQEQNTRNAIKSFLANSASSSSGSTSDASTDSPLAHHVTQSPHARVGITADGRHGGPQVDVIDNRPRSMSMSMFTLAFYMTINQMHMGVLLIDGVGSLKVALILKRQLLITTNFNR